MQTNPMTSAVLQDLPIREQAAAAADAAAGRAGLKIVELDDVDGIHEAADLLTGVWSATREEPLIPANTLRALAHSGNYVFGAYDRSSGMTGAIVGFLGRLHDSLQLHSHILGVSPLSQGRNIGFALKLHQRAWALAQGIGVVTWTFDPLVRRNAYFNIGKLGATVREYYPDFYGEMNDGINDGDVSDRILVQWSLTDVSVVEASEGRAVEHDLASLQRDGAVTALRVDGEGAPVLTGERGPVLLAEIPEDIVRTRGASKALADRWRGALREVFLGSLQDGYVAAGMTRSGWYVFRDHAD